MKELKNKIQKFWPFAIGIALLAFGIYQYFALRGEYKALRYKHSTLIDELNNSVAEGNRLAQEVRDKQYLIDSFQGQISNIGSVVGDLQKLQATDEELLRKYSKVYFLSENYVPARLAEMEEKYSYHKGAKPVLVLADVRSYLARLIDSARASGIELMVSSAFRSFDEQEQIKNRYTVIYGAGTANQFSAEQGYSEHQLGTAVDLATPSSGPSSLKFETDPAFKWLNDNAHKYGFVLSYPKGNNYYIFEPWHWRFVGVELATKLHEEGKRFYDLDQREIDIYLIKLFD